MVDERGAGSRELELRLLGPLEVVRAGELVRIGGAKSRVLLAALALEAGRIVSVDLLVEALWPGEAPETAEHAIQVYVSQLRKGLGAEAITRRGSGYALELDPERVDLRRFSRLVGEGRQALTAGDPAAATTTLAEALALWRGPALQDFTYDPFAQAEIARLGDLRLDALEARIDADLALGRHVDLVPEIEGLVRAHPLREHPRAQLMLALYRSGRQADALAAYRAAREVLVEELGLDPGPELRELEAAILRQDESLLLPETVPAMPALQFRRLVTILFVDVVDSMAMAESLDAESLAGVQRRYFDVVSAAIAHHGGTVEKYAGDAVMAAFGIPVSHEDDAIRAARAAFEVRTGVAALSDVLSREHGLGLEIRIGLAAGEVVATSTDSGQRFVAGDAVGVAARLQHIAEPGEVVVGDLVARLIDHAARLEPLGEIEVGGRKAPIRSFRLVELAPVSSAFKQRLDAPLAGRKRELAALRRALKRAADEGSPQAVVVVGPAGVGKSRLAAELTRRTRRITALSGRCLSYGDGITYWPLREIVRQAPESAERQAVVDALEAETSPPAAEIALLFRRLCEALAAEQPLVLVLDDVHWAEPTLLELVEGVVHRGDGPISLLCLARDDLLEERPDFLAGRANVEWVAVEPLPSEDAEVFLHDLGPVLDTDQRDRIVDRAEGNPLFLQQLVAFALEGGAAGEELPPTVQALLATRLDRLGPGERAVLERGAVIGKEFAEDDVTALLEPQAVPTTGAHLATLVERGFVRPLDESAFAFRHGLVRDAAYRAAPKRLRAELHERFADRLDRAHSELPDLDEFVGYHLEQAYRLRSELGEPDRRTAQLGEDAGLRLGAAGVRALKRADMPASTALLRRATSIPALSAASRSELLSELGIALRAAGDLEGALDVLDRATHLADAVEDRRAGARARMERAYVRVTLLSKPGDELLHATSHAIPVFEAAGDDRLVGRALLLAGWIHGGRRDQNRLRLEAAERALDHYRRSSWPVSSAVGEIANALYYGPTPVPAAIKRCAALLRVETVDLYGRANVEVFVGGLLAQTGNLGGARALVESATAAYGELGQRTLGVVFGGSVRGEVELLAGDDVAASDHLRRLCNELEEARAVSHRASTAGLLAEALYRLGHLDEAFGWTEVSESDAPSDDVDARVLWMPVRAKILARRGAIEEALVLATHAVEVARATDSLNRRAKAQCDLAEVLAVADRGPASASAYQAALELYEAKANVVGASQVRALLDVALV